MGSARQVPNAAGSSHEAQSAQLVAPGAEYFPFEQAVQEEAPATAKVPLGQNAQVTDPLVIEDEPAGQSLHCEDPAALLFPAAQAVQEPELAEEVVPAEQRRQFEAPEELNFPASHCVQEEAEAPLNVPA